MKKNFILVFCTSIFFLSRAQVGIGTATPDASAVLEVSATGGKGATATATMSGGVVTGLTLTNGGSGYSSPAIVTISGGGALLNNGKHATATATVAASGVISGLTLTNGGSGYTSTPTVSISGGNKGMLIPRVDISNTSSAVTPINSPADGLLTFNSGSTNPKTLYFWNSTSSPSAKWERGLLYNDTPKVAIIGLTGSPFFVLDNAGSGSSASLGDGRDTYKVFNSDNIPRLGTARIGGTNSVFYVPPGNYTVEVSLTLSAPPANPASNALATLGTSSYYYMGYFMDAFVGTINIAAATNAGGGSSKRKESPVISKVDDIHRVTWIYSYSLPDTISASQAYFFALNLGRMSGSRFTDGVNVIPSGSYIKISKF